MIRSIIAIIITGVLFACNSVTVKQEQVTESTKDNNGYYGEQISVENPISGEKLVNDSQHVLKLKLEARHAIGGEMEGAGVYSAAHPKSVPWIIVKSICDWGMNKNDEYQSIAAKNSADFVYHVLATQAFTQWVNSKPENLGR